MSEYPKPPFETTTYLFEDNFDPEKGPTQKVIDLNDFDTNTLLSMSGSSELVMKIVMFRLEHENQKPRSDERLEPRPALETGLLDVKFFVNPETLRIEGCFAFNFLGALERTGNDWEPLSREDTRLEEFKFCLGYSIDWDIDDNPEATVEESLEPHVLVEAFDDGTITLELVKKYCYLSQY